MLAAALWIGLYLVLVLTPLLVLLVAPGPPGRGFLWNLAIALGFSGTTMMGVQFLLTARFKRVTAPYGIDIIYAFHRNLAVVALLVVLAHPLLLLASDPALLGDLTPFGGPWQMTAGVLSLLLLCALVASSVWRKRLRLEYDRWRLWHVALALATFTLAGVHIEGVGYYVSSPWMRPLWIAIPASVAAVALHVRVVRPWWLHRRPYRVVERRAERGDAWTLELEPQGHRGFDYQPGQFAWLTLRDRPSAMHEHPFSFSSSPTRPGRLGFTIKELGDFTRTIKDVTPGTLAFVDGPYGAFSLDRYPAPGYVFVAGGIGIAPMLSMLRALADRRHRGPLLLVYGHRRWERVTFREDLETLQATLDLRVVYVLQEPPAGWTGETGLLTGEVLARHLPEPRTDFEYFVCGPNPMIEAVEQSLYRLGVPLLRIHSEVFDLV
jgi:predicted ferric reductase